MERTLTAFVIGAASGALAWLTPNTSIQYLFAAPLLCLLAGAIVVFRDRDRQWIALATVAIGVIAGSVATLNARGSRGGNLVFVMLMMTPYSLLLPLGAGALAGWGLRRAWQRPLMVVAALVCVLPALGVLVFAARVQLDLRRKPAETVRAHLLARAPVGSGGPEVRALINRLGWRFVRYDESQGFYRQHRAPMIGSKHVQADAGHYYELFRADVHVFWGFDADGRLVDAWVRKEIDGL